MPVQLLLEEAGVKALVFAAPGKDEFRKPDTGKLGFKTKKTRSQTQLLTVDYG